MATAQQAVLLFHKIITSRKSRPEAAGRRQVHFQTGTNGAVEQASIPAISLAVTESQPTARAAGDQPYWVIVLAVAVFVRLVTLVSYPPLIVGDGEEYWNMIWQMASGNYQSNLIFCSGYPFFMSFPVAILGALWDTAPDIAYRLLLVVQHALGASLALVAFDVLKRSVSLTAGVIGGLLIAISPTRAAWANQTRPEFMLGFFILLVLWLLVRASGSQKWTLLWYAAAGAAAGAMLLVRFNAVAIMPIMVLTILLCGQKRSWRDRGVATLTYLLAALIVFSLYIVLIHQPSTGSWRYSNIFGLSLAKRVADADIPFDASNGPWSRQLLRYHYVDVLSPDLIPKPSTHAQHIERELDEAALRTFLDAPDPSQTVVDGEPDEDKIYYFLGFERGDELLMRAALEAIVKQPGTYLADVLLSLIEYFTTLHTFGPDFLLPPPEEFHIHQTGALGFAQISMPIKEKWGYENPSWAWLPGAAFLTSYFDAYHYINVLYSIAFVVSLIWFLAAPRKRLLAGICWSIAAVWLLSVSVISRPGPRYRSPIGPVLDILLAISLAFAISVIVPVLRKLRLSLSAYHSQVTRKDS